MVSRALSLLMRILFYFISSPTDTCRVEVCAGPRIGKGGFSDIIEVKDLRPLGANNGAIRQDNDATHDEASAPPNESSCGKLSPDIARRHRPASVRTISIHETRIVDPSQAYVIKTIRKDLPHELEVCGIMDLAVEAQFLQTLSHPNIVSLHGVGDQPGSKDFFIMIERIDRTLGHELDSWFLCKQRMKDRVVNGGRQKREEYKLKSQRFMERRVAVAYQLTSALKYLHSKK
jgi:serine/threonine protein kinase